MAVKPDGQEWTIREQIFEDLATGLTFQFEIVPGTSAPFRLRIFGDSMPFANREILFNEKGAQTGTGTMTAGLCRPAWLQQVDS